MTPEQAALIQKTQESLNNAQLQIDHQFYGFAISRLYYAMFYLAEVILLIDGLTFSSHAAVLSKLGEHFAKTGRIPAHLHRYI